MGIRLDQAKAGSDAFTINVVTPDNDETYVVELSNGVLTNIQGYQAEEADLTLTLDRSELDKVFLRQAKLSELIEAGSARADGDAGVVDRLVSYQIDFDPRFQMVPGAGKAAEVSPTPNPFETFEN
jgi:alkyl sulfatase BDS1-like metallo-beta-lactamase superfamily hydrolase